MTERKKRVGSGFVTSLCCGCSEKVKRSTWIGGAAKWTENLLHNALVKEKRRVCALTQSVASPHVWRECVYMPVCVRVCMCVQITQIAINECEKVIGFVFIL